MFRRALILLLLVMNLGVAAWWWLRPAADAPAVVATDPSVPRLQLLGEARVAAPAPHAPVVSAAPGCFEFGPFDDDAAFAHAQSVLQPIAARMSVRRDATDGRGWRVWLPPLADRAAAVAMAARIVEAGLKDYYVVPDGVEANSIALGRYGNGEAARRRQTMLREAGFESLAEPLGSGTRWLQVATRPTSTVANLAPDVAALQRPLDCAAFAPLAGAG